jgi:uncharacterized membrane protein
MTYVYILVGALVIVWLWLKFRRPRDTGEGRRIGTKVDKKAGKIFELWLVNGKLEEREVESAYVEI